MVNFNLYGPLNCSRHSREENVNFCKNAGLNIEHIDVQESGITVVGRKV